MISMYYDTISTNDVYYDEYLLAEGVPAISSFKVRAGATAKEAKDHMRRAKALQSSNPNEAIKEYELAIQKLKECKLECENIDDDEFVILLLTKLIFFIIPAAVALAVAVITLVVSTAVLVIATIGTFCLGGPLAALAVFGAMAAAIPAVTAALSVTSFMFSSTFLCIEPLTYLKTYGWNKETNPGQKPDITNWTKMGVTRGKALARFDHMIKMCERSKSELQKHVNSKKRLA